MRGATECAKRLKLLFSSLRSKLGKVGRLPVGDPVTQMVLGIVSRDTPEAKANEGLDRLREMVVDYNELRVIPPIELAEVLGDFPDARIKCEDITRSLNRVFLLEHMVSLERLADLAKKDVVGYLEKIDGLEAYTRARIRLLGFRQHAIPLDEAMWALARREQIVDVRCPLHEAQQFLERQIAEENALEFVALFKRQAWSEMGTAVKRGEVARITSVPPDRTARNMLQMLPTFGGAVAGADEEDGELAEAALLDDDEASLIKDDDLSAPPKPAKRSAAESVSSSRRPAAPRDAKDKAAAKVSADKTTASMRRRSHTAARSRTAKSVGKPASNAQSA